MRLSEYASTQRTYGSRKVPRSVQQSIPIDRIYEDGTWRCGNVYSQMWSMPDINFTMSDEDNKAKILNLLGKVYMGVPSDCWLKICIVSQRMDEKSFRENVLLHRNLDGLDKWRVERNRRIRQCVQDAGNVVQHKYLILSTNKQNVTDARSRLRQVQGNLLAELSNLGCTIKPMTNNERLEVLHNFFRRGEEGRFQFSFDDYGKLGNDFRNTIAPDAMRFTTQHAEIDNGFAKAMTIAQYPQQLSDNFVATLLQQVPYIVLSIDITPVETEDAMREIEASQMKIDSEKDIDVAARKLLDMGPKAVLIKGGHFGSASDAEFTDWLVLPDEPLIALKQPGVKTSNNHGTGCTLSAAIATYLGLGLGIRDAIVHAQKFLNHCLRHGYAPGLGAGPPNHASWIAKRVGE